MAESAKAESSVQTEDGRMEDSVGSGDCCDSAIVGASEILNV
jgi:hypothetical protein